ncbi:hypothetical protein [Acidomonas methanolica]|uniref:hypothetical protein n=1 Tax=Acidomonas methanolica TaxID=437 RepID=UPI001044ABA0|nr:hypothetical protein [Acidomonas methanolica]MBU2654762.1 hypothetical protein [Acidomonas methanolica]TCS26381.1 hypothetical protein EDC31_11423 [Acidomonas methanolica]GBQ48952.1 hypothetical protein AA0498_0870 [Acidomonas methanolica]GEL00573.1 hypothetical protein AME01nite_30710 [Acidomonas methanolica NBRC 104435]
MTDWKIARRLRRIVLAVLVLCLMAAGAHAQESDDEDVPDSRHFRLAFPEGPQRQFIDAVLLGSVRGALADARALPDGVNTVGAHGHTALEAASFRRSSRCENPGSNSDTRDRIRLRRRACS